MIRVIKTTGLKPEYFRDVYVDAEMFECLNKYRWYYNKNGYAYTIINRRPVYMSRMILGLTNTKLMAEHKDGNTLNNTRENLRPANKSQNAANIIKLTRNTSGYRGVTWSPRSKKWLAQIKCQGKRFYLGVFKTREEAYAAYCKASVNLFGEYSVAA